MKKEDRSVKTN